MHWGAQCWHCSPRHPEFPKVIVGNHFQFFQKTLSTFTETCDVQYVHDVDGVSLRWVMLCTHNGEGRPSFITWGKESKTARSLNFRFQFSSVRVHLSSSSSNHPQGVVDIHQRKSWWRSRTLFIISIWIISDEVLLETILNKKHWLKLWN